MQRTAILGAAILATLLGYAGAASAEPPPPREWDLHVGAYGWLPAPDMMVEGTNRFTGGDDSRHFHKSLGDAFEDFDGGGGGFIDFRYLRFVGLLDAAWVQNDYNSDGWQTSTIVDAKLGFRVLDVDRPFSHATSPDGPHLRLDLLAGARYHDSEANVSDEVLDYDQSRDWFDPVVGLRWNVDLTRNLSFGAVADIGGFDIGDASHLTWSLNPRLNYRAWDHVDLFLGWKRLSDDHDGSRDVDLSGPQAGLGYTF